MNSDPSIARQRIYWQRTRRLTMILIGIWASVTFVVIFFARELSGLNLFGWPLSFYMAAQGLVVGYLLLIAFYVWAMQRLDRTLTDDHDHGI